MESYVALSAATVRGRDVFRLVLVLLLRSARVRGEQLEVGIWACFVVDEEVMCGRGYL